MPSGMVGMHLIIQLSYRGLACAYVKGSTQISWTAAYIAVRSDQVYKELESSTGCKMAQARLKLQVHGNMQDKHGAVLFKASVE